MISVAGYGSLLSEASARETVPGLQNFRLVKVPGYRRIFNKVGIVFISRHGADPESLQIASCSTQADPDSAIICSQFECSEADFLSCMSVSTVFAGSKSRHSFSGTPAIQGCHSVPGCAVVTAMLITG